MRIKRNVDYVNGIDYKKEIVREVEVLDIGQERREYDEQSADGTEIDLTRITTRGLCPTTCLSNGTPFVFCRVEVLGLATHE